MPQFLLVVGVIAIVLFLLRDRFEVVSSRIISSGSFCSPEYLPPTVGVAPEWQYVPNLGDKVRFFIDPTTGCVFPNRAGINLSNIVTLSDRAQIADFLQLNGAAPTGAVAQTPLGPALWGGMGWTCPAGTELRENPGVVEKNTNPSIMNPLSSGRFICFGK